MRVILSSIIGGAILSGCQIFPQVAPTPMYHLKPQSPYAKEATVSSVIAINLPGCDASLNTTRIVYSSSAFQREYYANVAWTDRFPKILQDFLITSFDDTGLFSAVVSTGNGAKSRFILESDISEFALHYRPQQSPLLKVEVKLRLFDLSTRNIVKAWTIKEQRIVASDTMEQIVKGYSQILSTSLNPIIKDISRFTKIKQP